MSRLPAFHLYIEAPKTEMLRSILSRSTQVAIAAMGYMAEIHADPSRRLSLTEIARSRDLQAPFLGKILVMLSRHGLVEGQRGPGGGYRLSRAPEQIHLQEVADLFEREDTAYVCPYGKDYCGNGPHCPLHHQLESLNESMDRFLQSTTFAQFADTSKVEWQSGD